MFRKLISVGLFASSVAAFGCGGSAPANSNSNSNGNINGVVNANPANLPPGLSTSPIEPSNASTPGIPAVVANVPKGATPTPGIPSPEELKKPMKPGVTPTPGIPSPEEMRRQMGAPPKASNSAPTDVPMMKKNSNTPSMMKKNSNSPSMMKKNTNQ